ncbi:MAG: DMT family transporter [Spirochaetia bacterium]
MNTRILMAIAAALMSGTAIALQSTLAGRAGEIVGSFRTGLLVNLTGGATSIIILAALAVFARQEGVGALGAPASDVPRVLLMTLVAGWLGIAIVTGVAYSVQGVGVTAGLSAIIMTQLLVGAVIDSTGAGAIAVTIDVRRIAGLICMGVGVWLLVPRG